MVEVALKGLAVDGELATGSGVVEGELTVNAIAPHYSAGKRSEWIGRGDGVVPEVA